MIGILCGTFAVIAALLWAGIWYLRRPRGRAAAAAAAAAAAGRGSKGVNATLVSNHHNTSGGSNGGGDHDTSSSDIDLKPSGSLVVPQVRLSCLGHFWGLPWKQFFALGALGA